MNPKCPNCNYNLIQNIKDSDIKNKVIPETIHGNKAKIKQTNLKERRGYNGKSKFKRIMDSNRSVNR